VLAYEKIIVRVRRLPAGAECLKGATDEEESSRIDDRGGVFVVPPLLHASHGGTVPRLRLPGDERQRIRKCQQRECPARERRAAKRGDGRPEHRGTEFRRDARNGWEKKAPLPLDFLG